MSRRRAVDGRPRILVVEDEAIISRDLALILERLGYTVVGEVASGEESISAASEREPDLIMMDVALKGRIDGVAAAGEIRRRRKIPVLFLTAYGAVGLPGDADAVRDCPRLSKPFEEAELAEAVRRVLDEPSH